MSTKRRLLERLVSLHERDGRPRSAEQLAGEVDAEAADVREQLESLRSYELVKLPSDGSGYLPTITARELLELDVDEDEFLIIDVPDNDPDDG